MSVRGADDRELRIPVVLASERLRDQESLEAELAGTPWALMAARERRQAVQYVQRVPIPIVLLDRRFAGVCWQAALRELRRARRRVRVIVLTDQAGAALWSEVLRRGGFDLIARPFDRDEILATLISAYAECCARKPLAV